MALTEMRERERSRGSAQLREQRSLSFGSDRAHLRFYLGALVHACYPNGQAEAGQVEGLTRVEGPSPRAGFWYLVVTTSGEAWFHGNLVTPALTTGPEDGREQSDERSTG